MIHFSIEQWQAWAPGLENADDWARWSDAPAVPRHSDTQPEVAFLPAMQRRRLSRLARMTFAVAWPLAEGRPPMPLVFASRHGETPRNFELLSDLARQEALSPTQFSLSVHNAIIGLWSIMRGDASEMTAIAARDGLEQGLLEAALLLADGHPEVLLVVAEDAQPEPYQPWIEDAPFPHALALRLAPGRDWSLSQRPAGTDANATPATWPHALQLVRALSGRTVQLSHATDRRQWLWQKQP